MKHCLSCLIYYFLNVQILTSVQVLKLTSVTPTPGVPTLKDHTTVAASGALTGTARTAQVKRHPGISRL